MDHRMIELHYAPTPNGHKIAIALEELALPYEVHRVDIGQGDQFCWNFSPSARTTGSRRSSIMTSLMESRQAFSSSKAILVYLAEKTGKLLPASGAACKTVMEWLMWQMGGFGPMLGQAHHFIFYAKDKIDYAVTRYGNEANRLYGVLTGNSKGANMSPTS